MNGTFLNMVMKSCVASCLTATVIKQTACFCRVVLKTCLYLKLYFIKFHDLAVFMCCDSYYDLIALNVSIKTSNVHGCHAVYVKTVIFFK